MARIRLWINHHSASLKTRNPELKLDIEIPPLSPIVHVGAAERPPLYWIDTATGTLHRLVGDTVENLTPNVKNVNGLSVDADGGKLYWTTTNPTNPNRGTLNSANLDGFGCDSVTEYLWCAVIRLSSMRRVVNSTGRIASIVSSGSSLTGTNIGNVVRDIPGLGTLALAQGTRLLDGDFRWEHPICEPRRGFTNDPCACDGVG